MVVDQQQPDRSARDTATGVSSFTAIETYETKRGGACRVAPRGPTAPSPRNGDGMAVSGIRDHRPWLARCSIAPSVLPADFPTGRGGRGLEAAGGDRIHWDVMDGVFVPNLTFGPDVVAARRTHTSVPFEAHLMVVDPDLLMSARSTPAASWSSSTPSACRPSAPDPGRHPRGGGPRPAWPSTPRTPLTRWSTCSTWSTCCWS